MVGACPAEASRLYHRSLIPAAAVLACAIFVGAASVWIHGDQPGCTAREVV